jgi:hypothetical protein
VGTETGETVKTGIKGKEKRKGKGKEEHEKTAKEREERGRK